MPPLNRRAVTNFFGLADEEGYEYQDYPETTKEVVQSTKKNTTQNQSTHSVSATNTHEKRKTTTSHPVTHENIQPTEKEKAIELHQSSTETIVKERTASRTSIQPKANLAGKVAVMEPGAYSEAMAIAERIIAGEVTLVNFYLVEEKQARRIVGFLAGTVYALNGGIKRVGDEVFLCTPTEMEIDSSTAQSFADVDPFDL